MPPPSPARRASDRQKQDDLCPVALAVLGRARDHRPKDGRPPPSGVEQIAGAFATVLGAAADLAAIRERLAAAARALQAQATAGAVLAALEDGLHPDHGYDPEQGARFLGMKRSSYLKVSPELLPRFGAGRVLGIDLMAMRGDLTREEAAAYKAAKTAGVRRLLDRAA